MSLLKNTIAVQFINMHNLEKPDTKIYVDYHKPLKEKQYSWFVTPQQRKKLDIGSIIKNANQNPMTKEHDYAVVVNNFTTQKAEEKFETIQTENIQPHHLRHFIRDMINDDRFAELAYIQFHEDAREGRTRYAAGEITNEFKTK